MRDIRERDTVKRFACSVTSLGEFDALYSFSSALARDGTCARSGETALGWRTRGREDRDTLCSLHRGLAATWVINVTIQRSECRAVNGVTFNVGQRLLDPVL